MTGPVVHLHAAFIIAAVAASIARSLAAFDIHTMLHSSLALLLHSLSHSKLLSALARINASGAQRTAVRLTRSEQSQQGIE